MNPQILTLLDRAADLLLPENIIKQTKRPNIRCRCNLCFLNSGALANSFLRKTYIKNIGKTILVISIKKDCLKI